MLPLFRRLVKTTATFYVPMLCAASDAQCSTYLLLDQFSIRTEIFFLSIYGPSTKRAGRQKKTKKKKKRNKTRAATKETRYEDQMFALWLPVWGTGKVRKQLQDTLQDTRFDSHLTGVKKRRFYWFMKTLTHKKGFPRK